MEFTRSTVRALQEKLEIALKELGEAEGVEFNLGNRTRFSATQCSIKLECSAVGGDGTVSSKVAEDFKIYCHRYNLVPENLGDTFTFQGKPYKITGCKPQSSKFPILGERSDGKVFKFRPTDVKRGI
jgi:hypothetical protein